MQINLAEASRIELQACNNSLTRQAYMPGELSETIFMGQRGMKVNMAYWFFCLPGHP